MKNSKLEKEANTIDKLIAEGRITEEDLPLLVNEGLAQETVDYWKSRKYNKSLWEKIVDFFIE